MGGGGRERHVSFTGDDSRTIRGRFAAFLNAYGGVRRFKKKKKGSIEPLERREERPKWRFLSFVLANHEI